MRNFNYYAVAATVIITSSLHAHNNNKEFSFISQFFKSGDLVFDVGAHVGKKTDLYLQGGARVICFEPQPSCIQTLHALYSSNKNVTIVEKGLSDTPGTLELAICTNAPGISTFSKDWQKEGRFAERNYQWDQKVTAELITLDTAISMYGMPQFCKIDVEQFEYQVLKGLSQPIPFLSFECHQETMAITEQCIQHLRQLGYNHFNFSVDNNHTFAFDDWVPGDQIIPAMKNLIASKDWSAIWGLWGDMYAKYELIN